MEVRFDADGHVMTPEAIRNSDKLTQLQAKLDKVATQTEEAIERFAHGDAKVTQNTKECVATIFLNADTYRDGLISYADAFDQSTQTLADHVAQETRALREALENIAAYYDDEMGRAVIPDWDSKNRLKEYYEEIITKANAALASTAKGGE